jgi:hypothetical protein
MRPAKIDRRGSILVCVLVCLGIASAIVIVSVRSSLQARRQMRQELQLEQTRWLLEAGLVHAVTQLRNQPTYQGETWQVSPPLPAYPHATVDISVATDGAVTDKVRMTVTAKLRGPDALSKTTQRSKTLLLKRGLTLS